MLNLSCTAAGAPPSELDLRDVRNAPYLWHKGPDFVKDGVAIALLIRMATIQDTKQGQSRRTRYLWDLPVQQVRSASQHCPGGQMPGSFCLAQRIPPFPSPFVLIDGWTLEVSRQYLPWHWQIRATCLCSRCSASAALLTCLSFSASAAAAGSFWAICACLPLSFPPYSVLLYAGHLAAW